MSTSASDSVPPNHPATTTQTIFRPPQHELPDEPLVIIEPSKPWSIFDFSELWAYRELLYFLTWRDLKVRYKQTLFGVAWVLLQPVLMTIIFTVFLGMLVRVPTYGLPYPLFVYSGLLLWTFFSSAVLGCTQSLVSNANLITKVYFPRVLIPAAHVAGRLVDFAISVSILLVLILFYRLILHYPLTASWKLAIVPIILILMVLLTLSMGMLVSCLNVKYRDVGVAIPVLMQLWMFTSPVLYSVTLVPEKWRTLYSLNPLVGLIQGFRAALLNEAVPLFALVVTAIFTITILIVAVLTFQQTEKSFADIV
jgi:lipopolysaccharide transport system permease protein